MSPPESRRVEVHLGTLCNNRCVFCMSGTNRDQKEPWANSERVREELRHFYKNGCRAAGFLGGEPTVYPHIVESIAYAKSLGYTTISLCTNGTRLSDAAFCRALVDAGLTRVTLSVHSHHPEVEDGMITLVPGNLARKLAAIDNLVALRSQGRFPDGVSLNPVLCRPTLLEMEDYIAFFAKRGLEDIRFNYIWPQGDVQRDKNWIPSYRQAMPEILRVLLVNEKRLRRRLSFGGIPRCALRLAGISGRLLDYFADKYLDESALDADNDVSMATKKGPMEERFVWQQVKRDILKTQGPGCADCGYKARCEGVWRSYADLYGFGEFQPLGAGRAAAAAPSLAECHEGSEGQDLLLRTTFACNQRCPFCFVALTGRPAAMGEIERNLKLQALRAGPLGELTISGGEPTSDARLPRILAMARRLGFRRFILQTNAVYLARPGLLEDLVASGVKSLLVSFHSHKEELYDRITGSRGQFSRALAGLTRLLGTDACDVTVNIVVNALNFKDLPEWIDFLGNLCAGKLSGKRVSVYFSMINEAGHQKAPEWAVALELASPYLREASRRGRRLGFEISKSGGDSSFPVCVMGTPRRHAPRRTFPQQRVRYADEFSGAAGAIGRAKRPSCRECRYDAKCAGVPAAYAARFGLEALRAS